MRRLNGAVSVVLVCLSVLIPGSSTVLAQSEIRVRAASSADDGYYTRDLSNYSTTANSNYFGRTGGFERRQYVRWSALDIPVNAVVDSAWLKGRNLTSAQTNDPIVIVRVFATDSAPQIADSAAWTAAWQAATVAQDSVDSWDDWTTAFAYYRMPFDIASLVQEVVSRPGWKPGNAMGLLFEGRSSAERTTSSRDNGGGDSLIVFFHEPSPLVSSRRRILIRETP